MAADILFMGDICYSFAAEMLQWRQYFLVYTPLENVRFIKVTPTQSI